MRARAYRDGDLAAMAALVREAWAAHGPRVECTSGDLSWRMYRNAGVRPDQDIHLWESEAGRLLGFAWRSNTSREVDLFLFPRASAPALVPVMLEWIRATGGGTAWALASNAPLVAALRTAGWGPTGGCYLHLARTLDALPERRSVPGYRVRAVRGPEEVEARAAVHRRGFGTGRVTPEVYARVMRAPGYRQDLDLVAEAEDGELAALALCWCDAATGMGALEPVATAPEHRRRGLARALVVEGLWRLRDLGARTAVVYAREGDAAAALYEAAGFRVVDRNEGHLPAAR